MPPCFPTVQDFRIVPVIRGEPDAAAVAEANRAVETLAPYAPPRHLSG